MATKRSARAAGAPAAKQHSLELGSAAVAALGNFRPALCGQLGAFLRLRPRPHDPGAHSVATQGVQLLAPAYHGYGRPYVA